MVQSRPYNWVSELILGVKRVQNGVDIAVFGNDQSSEPSAIIRVSHGLQLLNAVDELDLTIHVDEIEAVELLIGADWSANLRYLSRRSGRFGVDDTL